MTKIINGRTLLAGLGGIWAVLAISMAFSWPVTWLGLPLLAALPGWLLLAAAGLHKQGAVRTLLYSVGLSVVLLLGWGWVCNALLPVMNINQPLAAVPLQVEMHVLMAVLFGLAWRRVSEQAFTLGWRAFSVREFTVTAIPFFLIALSIGGAFLLNNGGSGWLSWFMLAGVIAYAAFLVVWRATLRGCVIAWGIYGMALSLLLMTALRSWFISGHDIQQEFYAFQLTKDSGLWSMAAFRDAYNACLSITILPTQFLRLLHIPDAAVYKVVFPILFALTPSVIYLIVRQFATRFTAILSALYFMAVPTFFADMPMLNRQMIAFLLLALALLALFDAKLPMAVRRLFAIVFGLGLVVSHYSTTYIVVGILAAALVLRWLVVWLVARDWSWVRRIFSRSSIGEFRGQKMPEYALNVTVVGVLVIAALAWSLTTWVTNPNQLASNAWDKTEKCVTLRCTLPERSGDTGLSLLGGVADINKTLDKYKTDYVEPAHDRLAKDNRFPLSSVDAKAITAATPTAFTPALFGLPAVTDGLYAVMVRVVQVFMLLGAIAVLFWDRYGRSMPTEVILISVVSLGVVIASVAVPGLSVRYGVFRAFEQSLIVGGPLLVVGTFTIFTKTSRLWQRRAALAACLLFMVFTTGIAQFLFGGGKAQLYLSSSGVYYDLYYTHQDERRAIDWLAAQARNPRSYAPVQMDSYMYGKWRATTGLLGNTRIYPALIQKNSYVLLGHANVTQQKSAVFYKGTVVQYHYPVSFLDSHKDLLYSSGDVRVYR